MISLEVNFNKNTPDLLDLFSILPANEINKISDAFDDT